MEIELDDLDTLIVILAGKKACSIRELAKETFKAISTVQQRLNRLQRYGYLDWVKGQHRSIHLTEKGKSYVQENRRVSATQA